MAYHIQLHGYGMKKPIGLADDDSMNLVGLSIYTAGKVNDIGRLPFPTCTTLKRYAHQPNA